MADWHFDWLDVPRFVRAADAILEYPMVDQDPLPRWSFGRLTLLGDAAHPATTQVVLANRKARPDAILQEVYRRTGDKPFKAIDDVISHEEFVALSESYKRVAGYDKERLKRKS